MIEVRLGLRLHKLRGDRDWSLIRLAEISGVDRRTIARYERGVKHPSLDTLDALAAHLGLTLAELFTGV